MVADVRQKIESRLRALMTEMDSELAGDLALRAQVQEARTVFETAQSLRAAYRSRVVRAFPGCTVAIAREHVSLWLPDRYPNHHIPIVERIHVGLIDCFSPRGLSNQPF